MRVNDTPIVDQYSFLDYKAQFDDTLLPGQADFWAGQDELRRLKAYAIYEAYYRNESREFINTDDLETKKSRREYGDSFMIVETALSSLLGKSQAIVVKPDSGTKAEVTEVQNLLEEWEDKDRFKVKLGSCERSSIKKGDGVYAVGLDGKADRPKLTVWDPAFFFPVWDEEHPENEFPDIVHIGYDFERENDIGETERFFRRITWELVPLIEEEEGEDGVSYTIEPGNGLKDRPWNGEDTTHTVLYSDMVWEYEDLGNDDEGSIFTLEYAHALDEGVREEDMEIDWIPVVHITNSDTESGDHFGISVLAPTLQAIDDLISTDTDLQASSATTGSPPLVIQDPVFNSDEDGSISSYGPGEVIGTTGDTGSATMIDTSRSLDALLKYDDHILSRVSVNGRIPESLMGRVKPSEVPSGITLTLSFAPHSSMIGEMRLVRKSKYQLLLKFIQRFYVKLGKLKKVLPADLVFGTFLPADMSETKEIVSALYEVHAISLETAVTMMIQAGFPIKDAIEEVKRIQAHDFEGAAELLGVTGDVNDSRKYLGLPPLTLTEEEQAAEDELSLDTEDLQ